MFECIYRTIVSLLYHNPPSTTALEIKNTVKHTTLCAKLSSLRLVYGLNMGHSLPLKMHRTTYPI